MLSRILSTSDTEENGLLMFEVQLGLLWEQVFHGISFFAMSLLCGTECFNFFLSQ